MAGDLDVGDTLGPYRLDAVIGHGGMGIVYRARRETDGATLALKILRKELSGDETYRRRFLHEARIGRQVTHPNLVPIVDAGEEGGRQYLAAAYVAGGSLADRIRAESRLAADDAVRVAADVAAGLDALHGAGLVHRDLKPSNIMLADDGGAALTDFGLAKGPAYTALTRPGQLFGTVDYLAPELISGGKATSASDLYALGCVVFECLSGRPPFASNSIFEVTVAHLDRDPADPCAGRSDAPPELGAAVLQALAKDPGRRPPTARAYALSLWRAGRLG